MSAINRIFGVIWSGRTWRATAYLLAGLPLGVLWFTWAVTAYSTGVSLIIIWVGVPLLVLTQVTMRWIGSFERVHINSLLDAGIDRPAPPRLSQGVEATGNWWTRMLRWSVARFGDAHAWRVAAWTVFRGVFGPVGFSFAVVAVTVPFSLLATAVWMTLIDFGVITEPWTEWGGGPTMWVRDWGYWLLYPITLLFAVPCAWLMRGLGAMHVPVAAWALGQGESERVARAEERAERAEERIRIDQELHDSIGHMITMTVVQAGAGAHVFESDPAFAKQALRNIEQRGRAAMGELDRIIAQLRGDEPETRAPLPGIGDLPGLIDGSRAAGMTIDATLEAPEVAPAVGRAAFGIVREALTNAAKHAPGAAVEVTVTQDGDALAIRVANGSGGAPIDEAQVSGRRGVAGIRDRVGLLGGASRIGPTDDGGFEVMALIPLEASLGPASEPDSPWSALRETVGS